MLEYLLLRGDDVKDILHPRTSLDLDSYSTVALYKLYGRVLQKSYPFRQRPVHIIDLPVYCIAIRYSFWLEAPIVLGDNNREYHIDTSTSKITIGEAWSIDLAPYLLN
jgi:hypothetical protein